MKTKLTIVLEPCAEGGYSAYVKEIAGVISQGATASKALDNISDALKELARAKLAEATGPEEIREALKGWTPEELAEAGIV